MGGNTRKRRWQLTKLDFHFDGVPICIRHVRLEVNSDPGWNRACGKWNGCSSVSAILIAAVGSGRRRERSLCERKKKSCEDYPAARFVP